MRRAAVGRADLVWILGALEEPASNAAAELLGWVREPPAREGPDERQTPTSREGGRTISSPEPVPLPWSESDLDLAAVPFLRVEAVEHLAAAPEPGKRDLSPLTLAALAPRSRRPALEPIAPWSRLWPVLQAALHALLPSLEVDLEEVVDRWSRGERLERLPLRELLTWSSRVVVVRDRSRRLVPYWEDEDEILRRLVRLVGERVIHGATLSAGPGSPLFEGEAAGTFPVGAPLLALTDLGLLGRAEDRGRWLSWGRELHAAGHRLSALVPVPPSRWETGLAQLWRPIWWDRGTSAVRFRASDDASRSRQVERLLRLLSFVRVLEPGLLRSVRRLLPAEVADSSLEAEVWASPVLSCGSWECAGLDPERSRELLSGLAGEPLALVRRVADRVRAWHRGQPREIWNGEVEALAGVHRGALPDAEVEAEEDFGARLAFTVAQHGDEETAFGRGLGSWFRRDEERIPEAGWESGRTGPLRIEAWARVHRDEPGAEPPPGVSPSRLAGLRALPLPVRGWEARQVGERLELWPQPEPGDFTRRPGSHLAELPAGELSVRVRELGANGPGPWRRVSFEASPGGGCSLAPGMAWEIESDRVRVTLGSVRRDEHSPWSAMGRDRYGLWGGVELAGVRIRLRWIPPGQFVMGSPEEEPGRWQGEGSQHQVTLTRGFWLGETAVTQALWEAVMGENPSRFRTPDRPVEQVTWDDCEKFLERTESLQPGLRLRLPSEAEWEYACRAGTVTATYAGAIEIRGENDAPILDGIAWYGGNSGERFELEEGEDSSGWKEKQYDHRKAGSHPVAQKQPNRWGLYDMLGNVWEWCEDRWSDRYDGGSTVDPPGPSKGTDRVSRGGSWIGSARNVRAACRLRWRPGDRSGSLGVRLARGQEGRA